MNINKIVITTILVFSSSQAYAYTFQGAVYCDVNENGQIDMLDSPMEDISVVATGAVYPGPMITQTDLIGSYDMCLHCQGGWGADIYTVNLDSSTLGALAEVVVPAGGAHTVDLSVAFGADGVDFLVGDPACAIPTGGEGCTPGYWRQDHHYDSWSAAYSPETLFSDVFEDAFPGLTLGEVVTLKGGGLNALGRHTVAALLSASSSLVSYELTSSSVINDFNDVFPSTKKEYNSLKTELDTLNNEGCPLN